ncbi:hypothetical protein [Streptomyces sp. NPDC006551]|uniref:hypothetical protein n=1 Tax=Streptomyces sp. NPDC006551 TaxID=3157178 RepID=UPI0033AE68B2
MPAAATSRIRRAAAAVALSSTLTLGTAACVPSSGDHKAQTTDPFEDMTGSKIAEKAFAATRKAGSATLSRGPGGELANARLAADTSGKCTGTMTFKPAGTVELVIPEAETGYLRFDEAYLRAGASSTAEADTAVKENLNLWTEAAVTDPDFGPWLGLCDLNGLLNNYEMGAFLSTKGAQTTVGGRKAVTLTRDTGTQKFTYYVATDGEPYLLRITEEGGDAPGTVTLSDFGRKIEAQTPPEAYIKTATDAE